MCGDKVKKLFLTGKGCINNNNDGSDDKKEIRNTLSSSTRLDGGT